MHRGRRSGGRFARLFAAVAVVASLAICAGGAGATADPGKVLHVYFVTGETGFDPARVSDNNSATVNEAIFERLLTYDYLARPAKLVPMVTEAMPEVTDNGRTYTFRIRKGILFAPDPAFDGKPRELGAEDFIYSFKRFFDPKLRSPYAFMLGDIVGLKEAGVRAEKSGKFDYEAPIDGLQALDRYTLRIRLAHTDYDFAFKIAHTSYGAVAREVIERYADDTMAHPVGTGPYMLKQWVRTSKIILDANPNYRGFVWDFNASEPAWDDALIAQMKGKRMPQVGRVEISVIDEPQSVWLAFEGKELDYINLPAPFRERALAPDDSLLPKIADQGISLYRAIDPEITYTAFNFRDPVVGGFAKEKIALRRAIIMAYDQKAEIDVLRKRLAVNDDMPIPPGVVGYDPNYHSINRYDPDLANKLLDYFGYKKGADGWRTMPDGKPLVLRLATETGSTSRDFDELWQRSLDRIAREDRVRRAEVRRQREGGEGLQADDVGPGVDRRLSGRRQLHAAPLRPEHRAEQQRLLRVEGVRRVLRKGAAAARFARAQHPLSRDDAADGGRRRLAPRRVARSQSADPAVGEGLQEASDPARRMAVPRCRSALVAQRH